MKKRWVGSRVDCHWMVYIVYTVVETTYSRYRTISLQLAYTCTFQSTVFVHYIKLSIITCIPTSVTVDFICSRCASPYSSMVQVGSMVIKRYVIA